MGRYRQAAPLLVSDRDGDTDVVYQLDGRRCLAALMQFDSSRSAGRAAETLRATDAVVTIEERTLEGTRCVWCAGYGRSARAGRLR